MNNITRNPCSLSVDIYNKILLLFPADDAAGQSCSPDIMQPGNHALVQITRFQIVGALTRPKVGVLDIFVHITRFQTACLQLTIAKIYAVYYSFPHDIASLVLSVSLYFYLALQNLLYKTVIQQTTMTRLQNHISF